MNEPQEDRIEALRNIEALKTNPEFSRLMDELKKAETRVIDDVLDHRLDGISDIFNREQLFGEIRGLRRMQIELDDRCEQLTIE